ncbi:hypothetical protein F0562_031437 [Nyssa sinensis]|uniref:Phytocyanin domain-containing protein n=1 Tax=Nyssa sinensis TaxID=561372 RepID=A0A5J5ATW8_9ASTE|nr:hypothetical protein F0562_031437 [Nyssa sinensis]
MKFHALFSHSSMAEQLLVHVIVILGLSLTCTATVYTVGDTSGWDISSDLDTWVKNKRFVVGDVLLFQYSSSHTVDEVTKEGFQGCNTTNVLQMSSNGNTSIPLSKPGDRFFICGNKLHCLGGMKLQVNVEQGQVASPSAAPRAQPGDSGLPPPTAKSDNPSSVTPNSAMFIHGGIDSLVLAFMGFMATLLWLL